MSNAKQKAVFLDRDDTLIEDSGYISHPAQVKLLPGAAASLIQLRKMDFRIVVVSNQSGIARGILTEETLAQIHHQLEKLLADENAYLDAIYYCPFHPDGMVEKYRMESDMRKPAPGMLLKAAGELDIDLSRSWMIGDSYRDIEAGRRAGCKTILINNPVKPAQKNPSDPQPDRQAVNIREAVNIIRMYELRQSLEIARKQPHTEPAKAHTEEHTEPVQPEQPQPDLPQTENPPQAIREPAVIETPPAAEPEIQQQPEEAPAAEEMQPPVEVVEEIPAVTPAPKPVEKKIIPQEKPASKPAEPLIQEPAAKVTPAEPVEPVERRQPPIIPVQEPQMSARTEKLLQELINHLKSVHRVGQYDDFTLSKVLAGAVQVLAVACMVVSLWFYIDSTRTAESVLIMLGYAAVLQLMAIAFYIMRDRG